MRGYIIWLLSLFYQLQLVDAKWSLRKYPIAGWAISQVKEFNSRTLLSLLHTKECYSGKGGAVAFFSWKDITKEPSGAPSHRPWVWVGQGGFLSLLLALGHGWDRQGAEKVKFLSAAWLLFLRLQPWSGSSPVCLWFSNCVRPGAEAQSRTEMSCSDQGPGCLSGVETLQNR